MRISVDFANEMAEAVLDAVQMVYEEPKPVGIVFTGKWVVATRRFEPDEAIFVVVPPQEDDRGRVLRLVA